MRNDDELIAIEALALELAQVAGAQIVGSLGRTLAVRYKTLSEDEAAVFQDPVSEIDQAVEAVLRARLAARFPDHGIIGEEVEETTGSSPYTWVIDPVDGTANFINGFPLFAASIGVVREGVPVVGAVWCSTSHALRHGVYHARLGGPLHFDEETIRAVDRQNVHRRLVGLPKVMPGSTGASLDARQTGSSAVECAFVAAGLLSAARFERPNIWDVAGGIPLAQAIGADILTRASETDEWQPFETFADGSGAAAIAQWKQPLLLGSAGTVAALR